MNINAQNISTVQLSSLSDSITERTLALWLTLARYKAATPFGQWRRGSAPDWCADWSRWWGSKRVLADQGRGIVPGPGGIFDGGEGVKTL